MRRWMVAGLGVTLLVLGGGAAGAIAAGTIPGANGAIQGCYNNATGVLRAVTDASQCLSATNPLVQRNPTLLETPLSWSQTGPPGAAGPQGPAGPAGVSGLELVAAGGSGPGVALCPSGKQAIAGGARAAEVINMQAALIENGPDVITDAAGHPVAQGWAGKASVQAANMPVLFGQVELPVYNAGVAVWATCITQAPAVAAPPATPAAAFLTITPDSLSFDSGIASSDSVTITNLTTSALGLSIARAGSNLFNFGNGCQALAPAASCTLTVSYTPPAGTAGLARGSLLIAATGVNGNPPVLSVDLVASGDVTCRSRPNFPPCLAP